jgi:hypothetical protein
MTSTFSNGCAAGFALKYSENRAPWLQIRRDPWAGEDTYDDDARNEEDPPGSNAVS